MQSSVWSNPSATAVSQQQQQQQQPSEHHHHQPEGLSSLSSHHDRVWTPPPPPHQPQQPQQQQAATSTTAAFRLAAGRGFSFPPSNGDETVRPSVSFPLLKVADSGTDASAPEIPLARRQQNYLQQRQQELLQQREHPLDGVESEVGTAAAAAVTEEAALKLAMKRKQLRHRVLIMVYLSCTLLFVLAVVFLAAFGVFHTAGSEQDSAAGPAARAANSSVSEGGPSLHASLRKGAPS